MNLIPGVSGTLFPGRYLAESLAADAAELGVAPPVAAEFGPRLQRWWNLVVSQCGPATATRALFDLVAMPLVGMLGFRAARVTFTSADAAVCLQTARGAAVALIVRPWAVRPSSSLRDVYAAAAQFGATWGFVLAPPFVSIVAARGYAGRRALDFRLHDIVRPPTLATFVTLAHNRAFDRMADNQTPIDRLVAKAAAYQARVRRDLQQGVVAALDSLSPACTATTTRWRRGSTGLDEALTIVYRILFLLFVESRDLVPHQHPIYAGAYAMSSLCRDAARSTEPGPWSALAATARLARFGCTSDLEAPAFNGALFARTAAPQLERRQRGRSRGRGVDRRDEAARTALVALGYRDGSRGREAINFRDLGVEQLGAIYERILDLRPPTGPAPAPAAGGRQARQGLARKQTGTFYTPQPLTDFVVRRTLAPLVGGASADQILELRVLDPAMGSGAFLVSSCLYLAAAYERALIDEGRANATDFDDRERASIRRLIAARCLAGVDRNPTAVQLARLSLWLTTLAAGKPLSFFDHRLRTGDSLIGAWPDDLDRLTLQASRRRADLPLLAADLVNAAVRRTAAPWQRLIANHGETTGHVRAQELLWEHIVGPASPLQPLRNALDLWCARWFWPQDDTPPPDARELGALLTHLANGNGPLPRARVEARCRAARMASTHHAFFHWPLEFLDVFYTEAGDPKPAPGFDAVIGNPPWEMVRADSGTAAGEAGRNGALVRFVRDSGAYPSCAAGHVNLYQPFVDRALALTRRNGRVGLVLPWGLATDDGAALLRSRLLDETRLDVVVGLDNRGAFFPIHRGMRFAVVTASPGESTTELRARNGVATVEELETLPAGDRIGTRAFPVRLTPAQLRTIGGPSRRLPDIRRTSDTAWLERIGRAAPALGAQDGWRLSFGRELNATEARRHAVRDGLRVIEGKHIAPFAVDPHAAAQHIGRDTLGRLMPTGAFERPRLAYRDVSSPTNRMSLIAAIVPAGVVTTHTLFCVRTLLPLERQHFLCALFNSFVLNAVVRAVMGGHVTTTIVEALPVPRWRDDARHRLVARLAARAAAGPARPLLLARLQALVAALYGLSPSDFRRILDTFPLVPAIERDRAAAYVDGGGGHESAAVELDG